MSNPNITIDTNVFVHLLNPSNNEDENIDNLLGLLVEKEAILCVDDKDRIEGEYITHIVPLFSTAADQNLRIYWLRYFMNSEWRVIPVRFGDPLMVSIRRQIRFAEPSDHIFVYVAISSNTVLISNNEDHITNNRNQLRKCSKIHRSKSTDFMTSRQAEAFFRE
jgi:hypothetical protein